MRAAVLALVLFALLAPVAAAQSCCLSVDADDPSAEGLLDGVQQSTALLIAVPFTMVGAFVIYLRRRGS